MSSRETPMTEGFWLSHAPGAYIPEYCLVHRGPDCGVRLVDAVILPDEPNRRVSRRDRDSRDRDYGSLAGRNIIVVQTKAKRMGMYLMGQALFSARLVMAQGAASVRSILLCTKSDSALLPHLKPFPEVEVWISDPTGKQIVRAQETAEVLRNVDPNTEQDKWPIGLLSDGTLNIVEDR